MKESFWGYWIVILGVFVVVIMMLISNVTTTNTQDYYLIKEVSEASMLDAVDYGYYRTSGELRINADKYVESFIRRFSESVELNTYQIDFYGIYEAPPKASVKVTTKSGTYRVGTSESSFDIVNRIDSILEVDGNVTGTNVKLSPKDDGNLPSGPVTPTPEITIDPSTISANCQNAEVFDASGTQAYPLVAQNIYKTSDHTEVIGQTSVNVNTAPTPLKIIGRLTDNWLAVDYGADHCGWIESKYVAVDLKEYLKDLSNVSININNQTSNIYTIDGQPIPGVTGNKYYSNDYVPLAQYGFATKLKSGLNNLGGMNVTIADAYRPHQASVVTDAVVTNYLNSRPDVRAKVVRKGYALGDFLASSVSSHNLACAVDIDIDGQVGVVKPSGVAELSPLASLFQFNNKTGSSEGYGYLNNSWNAYHHGEIASALQKQMAKGKVTQQVYTLGSAMVNSGLDILYTEWWHYQDGTCRNFMIDNYSQGLNFWNA